MRPIKVKKGAEACPKCSNAIDFYIHSNQVAEDYCEVWASCGKCGHHTPSKYRLEDVWGGTGEDNCYNAMSCWDDYVTSISQTA